LIAAKCTVQCPTDKLRGRTRPCGKNWERRRDRPITSIPHSLCMPHYEYIESDMSKRLCWFLHDTFCDCSYYMTKYNIFFFFSCTTCSLLWTLASNTILLHFFRSLATVHNILFSFSSDPIQPHQTILSMILLSSFFLVHYLGYHFFVIHHFSMSIPSLSERFYTFYSVCLL
jgi:hypothetical protein